MVSIRPILEKELEMASKELLRREFCTQRQGEIALLVSNTRGPHPPITLSSEEAKNLLYNGVITETPRIPADPKQIGPQQQSSSPGVCEKSPSDASAFGGIRAATKRRDSDNARRTKASPRTEFRRKTRLFVEVLKYFWRASAVARFGRKFETHLFH